MMPLDWFGILCALIALTAFVGNQYNYLKSDGFWYDALNLISALGLVYYAFSTNAYPFIITNTVWALVSGIDVVKHLLNLQKSKRHPRRIQH